MFRKIRMELESLSADEEQEGDTGEDQENVVEELRDATADIPDMSLAPLSADEENYRKVSPMEEDEAVESDELGGQSAQQASPGNSRGDSTPPTGEDSGNYKVSGRHCNLTKIQIFI